MQTPIENFLESTLVVQNALFEVREVEIPCDIQMALFDILSLVDKKIEFDISMEHQSLREKSSIVHQRLADRMSSAIAIHKRFLRENLLNEDKKIRANLQNEVLRLKEALMEAEDKLASMTSLVIDRIVLLMKLKANDEKAKSKVKGLKEEIKEQAYV